MLGAGYYYLSMPVECETLGVFLTFSTGGVVYDVLNPNEGFFYFFVGLRDEGFFYFFVELQAVPPALPL